MNKATQNWGSRCPRNDIEVLKSKVKDLHEKFQFGEERLLFLSIFVDQLDIRNEKKRVWPSWHNH